jgi:hypothetical protein
MELEDDISVTIDTVIEEEEEEENFLITGRTFGYHLADNEHLLSISFQTRKKKEPKTKKRSKKKFKGSKSKLDEFKTFNDEDDLEYINPSSASEEDEENDLMDEYINCKELYKVLPFTLGGKLCKELISPFIEYTLLVCKCKHFSKEKKEKHNYDVIKVLKCDFKYNIILECKNEELIIDQNIITYLIKEKKNLQYLNFSKKADFTKKISNVFQIFFNVNSDKNFVIKKTDLLEKCDYNLSDNFEHKIFTVLFRNTWNVRESYYYLLNQMDFDLVNSLSYKDIDFIYESIRPCLETNSKTNSLSTSMNCIKNLLKEKNGEPLLENILKKITYSDFNNSNNLIITRLTNSKILNIIYILENILKLEDFKNEKLSINLKNLLKKYNIIYSLIEELHVATIQKKVTVIQIEKSRALNLKKDLQITSQKDFDDIFDNKYHLFFATSHEFRQMNELHEKSTFNDDQVTKNDLVLCFENHFIQTIEQSIINIVENNIEKLYFFQYGSIPFFHDIDFERLKFFVETIDSPYINEYIKIKNCLFITTINSRVLLLKEKLNVSNIHYLSPDINILKIIENQKIVILDSIHIESIYNFYQILKLINDGKHIIILTGSLNCFSRNGGKTFYDLFAFYRMYYPKNVSFVDEGFMSSLNLLKDEYIHQYSPLDNVTNEIFFIHTFADLNTFLAERNSTLIPGLYLNDYDIIEKKIEKEILEQGEIYPNLLKIALIPSISILYDTEINNNTFGGTTLKICQKKEHFNILILMMDKLNQFNIEKLYYILNATTPIIVFASKYNHKTFLPALINKWNTRVNSTWYVPLTQLLYKLKKNQKK